MAYLKRYRDKCHNLGHRDNRDKAALNILSRLVQSSDLIEGNSRDKRDKKQVVKVVTRDTQNGTDRTLSLKECPCCHGVHVCRTSRSRACLKNWRGTEMEMEVEQSPQGPPFEHRMGLFNSITAAMRDAEGQLEKDGLRRDLIARIIGNCPAHALAYAVVNLDLDRADVAEWFLQYCADVETAQNNIAVRLDS